MESNFGVGDLSLLREHGDPAADEAVAGCVADASYDEAKRTLGRLLRNLRNLDDDPDVKTWVQSAQPAPPWVQHLLVAEGQELFTEWSLTLSPPSSAHPCPLPTPPPRAWRSSSAPPS